MYKHNHGLKQVLYLLSQWWWFFFRLPEYPRRKTSQSFTPALDLKNAIGLVYTQNYSLFWNIILGNRFFWYYSLLDEQWNHMHCGNRFVVCIFSGISWQKDILFLKDNYLFFINKHIKNNKLQSVNIFSHTQT